MNLRPVKYEVIPRHNGSIDAQTPGPWWNKINDSRGNPAVLIRCDNSHDAYLDHRIESDGLVKPSIGCHVDGCGWHVWGRLQGWTA